MCSVRNKDFTVRGCLRVLKWTMLNSLSHGIEAVLCITPHAQVKDANRRSAERITEDNLETGHQGGLDCILEEPSSLKGFSKARTGCPGRRPLLPGN